MPSKFVFKCIWYRKTHNITDDLIICNRSTKLVFMNKPANYFP